MLIRTVLPILAWGKTLCHTSAVQLSIGSKGVIRQASYWVSDHCIILYNSTIKTLIKPKVRIIVERAFALMSCLSSDCLVEKQDCTEKGQTFRWRVDRFAAVCL